MSTPLNPIQLSAADQTQLESFIHQGVRSARAIKRAQVILQLNAGEKPEAAAQAAGVSLATVYKLYHRYQAAGIQGILTERPRSGQPPRLKLRQEAELTTLACSAPPEGRVRWTLRLLASKAVELAIVDQIAPETVRQFLKKTGLSPG